ncbi:MAG: hypothetical protein KDB04_00145 [Acidimicrobiales bacterium]|nr:hypothetical protein [Acidimicrobiales bacterium]HRW36459.1 hypothetical protein [Aquihabitans sp.]
MGAERPVVLEVPADPRLLRVARVAVASVAAELPLTLQDVEDLRVAVDELAAALIEGCGPDATLRLEVAVDGDAIDVRGQVAGAGPLPALHPVAQDLLGLVAPGHELGDDGRDRTFRLRRRAAVATP